MNISKFKLLVAALFCMSAIQMAFVSCSDDPGVENYYTTTKEYASDYLQNREQFSKYVEVLQRATGTDPSKDLHFIDLLGTWGKYTVFAPTNDAIDLFLVSKGVGSVAELSKEDCDTIALNSIIESVAYFTTEYSNDTYPKTNMLDQFLAISTDDSITNAMYINTAYRLIHVDDSVVNGVVHTVDKVVLSNTQMIADFISNDKNASLYMQALIATHMTDSVSNYIDETYSVGKDSIDWTNDKLVFHTAQEFDNVAYMEHRYFKYTMFICPDSVLKDRYGITDLDGLRAKAKELYDPMYPEDVDVTDETDRRNSLNRFISYHILDRAATYYGLTSVDGANSKLAENFLRDKWDIADWYETMMPYSLVKFSFPKGVGLYINRRGRQLRADATGTYIPGVKVTEPSKMGRGNTCLNGMYYYIDGIIAYDQETQERVLNERLRIDATTLSPDFMTSGARGHYTNFSSSSWHEGGKYGDGDGTDNHNNKNLAMGFKAGAAKNFKYNNNTHLHVRPRVLGFWSYQGDEVTIKGAFDFTVKLPPVPKGTYELRLFTCVGFPSRGIIQLYIDGEPQGIPFDMRPEGDVLFGWQADSQLGDEDAISAFDKSIHNLGWMKGPGVYRNTTTTGGHDNFRDLNRTVRKVVGHIISDGKTDHYLRVQQKLESTENEMNFDFIELCPSNIYNNEYVPEDRL